MLIRTSFAGLLAIAAGAAQAQNFAQPISVTLNAPGGLWDGSEITEPGPISESTTLQPGASVNPGDGTVLGEFLLPNEFISLVGSEIHIRLAQGSSDGGTGYLGAAGVPATFTFSGLALTGQNIVGLTLGFNDGFGATGTTGVANLEALSNANWIRLIGGNAVAVNLDTLRFRDRGLGEAGNYADVRIAFQTAAVPEPTTWTLMLMGLALVGVIRSQSKRQA